MIKQYVNFDNAHEDLPRHEGARVHLRVTRQLWTGFIESLTTSAATRRLEWEVIPDAGNIGTGIVCAMSPSAQAAALAMAQAGSALAPAATRAAAPAAPVLGQRITAEGPEGHFTNTVTLPHTGGDKFSVVAHKLDKSGNRTGTSVVVRDIETWRRVYYDFYYSNAAGNTLYTNIKDRLSSYFAGGFVELVENRTGAIPHHPVTLIAMGQLFAGKAALNHAPNHLRLGIVDQWGRTKAATIDMPATDTQTGVNVAATATCSYDALSAQWSFRVRLQARSVFPLAGYLTRFRVVQQNAHDANYADIPPGATEVGPAFTHARAGDDDITVTVTSAAINAALTAAARPCRAVIQLSYQQLLGGSSSGQDIVITRRSLFHADGSADADAGVLIAFLHEIGHSIGMTDTMSPTFYFDDNGGRGPHCSTNADLVALGTARWNEIPRDQTISNQVYLPNVGGAGQCVMYHSRWTNMHNAVFCADCIDVLTKMQIRVR